MESETQPVGTTTIPSDPTSDTPAPNEASPANPTPVPSSPRVTSIQKLRHLLLRYISRLGHTTDRNLVRLSKLLSSPAATDALLCTVNYTLTLLHGLFSKILSHRLTSLATTFASKAPAVLLPGETLIATLPAPQSTKLLAQAVGSTKALADIISDFRLFVRMWGLVGIYTWGRDVWNTPLPADARRKDKVLRGVTWAQVASCVAFQVLENGAYLSSKGVLTSVGWTGEAGKARETRWWVWSSRFWAVHVGLEFVRLGVMWVGDDAASASGGDGEKEDKLRAEEKRREIWTWWKDLVNNVAYFPMTLHWSVEEGLLNDTGVGLCGFVAGGSNLIDYWGKTR